VNAFYTQLQAKLEEIPGATAAAISNDLPLETQREGALTVNGYHAPPGAELALTTFTFVMGDYFRTMGIPLIEGRLFTPADDENAQKTAIISRMLAKTYFAGRDPIGGQVRLGTPGGNAPWMTVVGVVGDVKAVRSGPADAAARLSAVSSENVSSAPRCRSKQSDDGASHGGRT
jgi:putative ABC transport system permease protein